MTRLPVPSQDDGVWGAILNDYLSVAHAADGTIKPSATADREAIANKGAASGYAPLDSGAKVPTVNLGASTASSSTFLRGDQTWAALSNIPQSAVTSLTADLASKVSKGSLVINVKDYGATGDGTTDDTTNIGLAVAALTTGATLMFPAGTYVTTGITITSLTDITIVGAGAFLVCSNQANPVFTLTTCSRVRVVGLHIKHASISGGRTSGGYGIRVLGCTDVDLDGITVTTVTSAAFWLLGDTGIRVHGCLVDGNLADGIHLNNDTTYGPCVDAAIVGNALRNTGDDPIAVVSQAASGTICSRVTITGNTTYNSAARGIAVVGADSVTVTGNTVSLTKNAGIYVAQETSFSSYGSTNVNIVGNTVIAALTVSGSSAAQGAIHVVCGDVTKPLSAIRIGGNLIVKPRREFIWIDGTGTSTTDVTVQDNQLVGPPVTTSGTVGILVGGGVANCLVANNSISYAGTHGVQTYGTDVYFVGNRIYKPNQDSAAGSWGIQRAGGTLRSRHNQVFPDGTKTALSGSLTSGPSTVAAGANAGTSPPGPVIVSGTSTSDESGQLTFGTGGTPAAGAQVVVTFQSAYGTTPRVVLTARNAATAGLGLYISAVSTTAFTISTANAPTASQSNSTYSLEYVVELV